MCRNASSVGMSREERPVRGDRVAGEAGAGCPGAVLADVGQDRSSASSSVIPKSSSQQPGGLVHLAHEVVHLVQRLGGRLDDEVDTVAEDVEVEVGDEGGDLDQRIGAEVEPGHLAVDPDEAVVHAHTLVPRAEDLRLSRDSASGPRVGTVKEWLGLVARRGGHRGIWAGAAKVLDPAQSVDAVRAYHPPGSMAQPVGQPSPVVEVVVGGAGCSDC